MYKRQAYAFALVGGCERQRVAVLAAADVLRRTRPIFPLLAMLSSDCWEHAHGQTRALLSSEGGLVPIRIPSIEGVRCRGKARRGGFFSETYSIFAMFTLSQYRAILYLDTDLAVLRNLDHILEDMLESWPLLAQARTPQACRTLDRPEGDDRLREEALDRWNTGVWAVRPSNVVYRSLVNFLQNGSSFRCSSGFQGAATTFFGRQGRYIKTEAEEALKLHVGYNLKPDVLSVQTVSYTHLTLPTILLV